MSVLAAAGALLAPSVAHAGEYPQHFCKSGPGDPQSNAWYAVGSGGMNASCAPGAAFPWDGAYYNTQSLPTNGYGGLRFDAPAGARYKALTINLRVPWQAQNRRTYIEANSTYAFSWWNGWGGSSSYNTDGNAFTLQLLDAPAIEIGQACHGASSAGCEAGDFYFLGAVATLTDTTAATVAPRSLGLFDPARTAFRGNVVAAADISDHGHGPASARIQVDGATVPGGTSDWLGTCNYRLPTPCAQRSNWQQAVNTANYPDGTHVLRMAAEDGVGNGGFAERTLVFDNTAPELSGTPSFAGETHSGDAASFPISASDETSGMAQLAYSIDGGPFTGVSGSAGTVEVSGAGEHTVVVRATDAAGNVAEQTSSFTLQAPPDNQRITTTQDQPLPGAPGPGDTIKCDVGSPWSEGTTFGYRWLRDGVLIEGATAQTYEVVAQDAGRSLVCRVVAENEVGTSTRETQPVTAGAEGCFGQTGTTDPCGDFDQDGQDNQTDPDDDGDGVLDGEDPAPYDPNVPGGSGGSGGAGGTGASGSGSGGTGVPGGTTGSGSTGGAGGSSTPVVGVPDNGVNASNRAKITVQGTRRRKVKFGRRIATVAHLRDESGRPITGAQVTVLERMKVPGAQWVPAREPLVSDSRGRLRWIIPAKYSRTIRYAYKANLANAEFQSTSDVVLSVLAKSTLKASRSVARNGQVVRFRGRVKSRPIPRGGVLIDLQARVGKRWQTFRTRRARGKGRWSVPYRFTSTRGVRTYRFRARVRQDTGYPYSMAATRSIRVKVHG